MSGRLTQYLRVSWHVWTDHHRNQEIACAWPWSQQCCITAMVTPSAWFCAFSSVPLFCSWMSEVKPDFKDTRSIQLINELSQHSALTYGIWSTFDFFYLLTATSHLLPWRPLVYIWACLVLSKALWPTLHIFQHKPTNIFSIQAIIEQWSPKVAPCPWMAILVHFGHFGGFLVRVGYMMLVSYTEVPIKRTTELTNKTSSGNDS